MRSLLTVIFYLVFSSCYCQYYFNDIVSTQLSNGQYNLLRTHKVKKIKATSFEADNSITDGFLLDEEISMDGKRSALNTTITGGKQSITNRTYELNRLKRTQTNSNKIDIRTDYTYTEKGQLQKILFTTTDTTQKTVSNEAHEWQYDEKGLPQSMLRIKNKMDTTFIELIKDEQGLIVEEHWKKKNRTLETYYYYYDAKNRLTDIVRFNNRLKKLFPDYLYEYDANGRVSQMTQLSVSSSSYIVWKYTYNEKGLKQSEAGFDKEKKLVGKIQYLYENY